MREKSALMKEAIWYFPTLINKGFVALNWKIRTLRGFPAGVKRRSGLLTGILTINDWSLQKRWLTRSLTILCSAMNIPAMPQRQAHSVRRQKRWFWLPALPIRNGAVILAYDNDVVGDKNRCATHEILAKSGVKVIDHIPQNKDFNEELLHQCGFIKLP